MILNIDKLLNANLHTHPWKHYLVDDLLNYDFTDEEKFVKDNDMFFQLLGELTFYKDQILEYFNPIRYDKNSNLPINTRVYWQIEDPFVEKEIHMDHKSKLWTCVIYAFPEKCNGTLLLDSNQNIVKEVPWKQNRAVIFSPGLTHDDFPSEKTWHQIINKTDKIRRVITLNIVTPHDMPLKTPKQVWVSKGRKLL